MTIKDIALAAGVSHQAVSAVLNARSNSRVGDATKERILKIARENGYTPSFGYRLMRKMSTNTVALMVSSPHLFGEEHVRNLVLNLLVALERRGYATYVTVCGPSPTENLAKLGDLRNRGAERFIFIGGCRGIRKIQNELERDNLPYVGTDLVSPFHVRIDSRSGIVRLLEFLRDRSGDRFRLLLFANAKPEDSRIQALRQLFPAADSAALTRDYVRYLDLSGDSSEFNEDEIFASARRVASRIMAEEPEVRGFFGGNDQIALGIARAAFDAGKVVGRDVFIAGFNNSAAVRNALVPISSASHQWEQRCELLIDAVLTPEKRSQIVLEPEVFIRQW